MAQWADIGRCPGHPHLDWMNNQYRDTVHRNTRDYNQNWICPSCYTVYTPSKNLLGDLPPFGCHRCGLPNPECYDWSMSLVFINGLQIDARIYDQGPTNYCALFAVIAAVDFARRLKGAFHGVIQSAAFDVNEMVVRYQDLTGAELQREPSHILYNGYDNLPLVLRTFRQFGIGYYLGAEFDAQDNNPEPVAAPRLYIDSFFKVDETDVCLVTRLISSGYPLVTSLALGALFRFTNRGQVYLSPHPWGGNCPGGSHAIALTGSGKAPNPKRGGVVETFYLGRNSHGTTAHSDYHMQNFGGDFLIFASDVRFIWGFTLKLELSNYAHGPWIWPLM